MLRAQESWRPVGPDGGDARSFGQVPGQPGHLYLGTTNNWIYESTDGGAHWRRLARIGAADGLILDHILVDAAHPETVFVAGWRADRTDGGLWVSHDRGRSWSEVEALHGQSIRSFAQAISDPKILYAGTLDGVFRSMDAGATWTLVSPPGSHEIHEIESLAIDPNDPGIVYAGTWHLPWKTMDGGATWHNIKKGLIDDSDVFSIILDPEKPNITYLSACSGIYKSENGGELFRKIAGIPATARRTRVLRQDPEHLETVYAGTTEGLYKTTDGGRTFKRMTDPDVIVNDISVDPANTDRVLLATDRGGVLASNDGGVTFAASNAGFSARQVEALLVDRRNPARLYAGVINDKTFGGVFVSGSGGAEWEQVGEGPGGGLGGRDVFALAQAQDGTIFAGTSHGIFALDPGVAGDPPTWQPRNTIANTEEKIVTETVMHKRVNVAKQETDAAYQLDTAVNALDFSGDVWLASTSVGLFTSRDQGATWQGGPAAGRDDYLSVAVHGAEMAAARRDGLAVSSDSGQTWSPLEVPIGITAIARVIYSEDGTLWLGTREGIYFLQEHGKAWMWLDRLPFRDVNDLSYDAHNKAVLVCSRQSELVYAINPKTLSWRWWSTGWKIGLVRSDGGRLIAASLNDGVLLEPQTAGLETEAQ
jgi:photosystem II stability/assembly factor-like uncharacterized protein